MTQIAWRCNEDYCGIIRKLAPLPMENLLASWSKTGTESFQIPKIFRLVLAMVELVMNQS